MSLLSRIRRACKVKQEAATTISLDRPLTLEERTLAEHLLRHTAVPGADAFIVQLPHARITGQCSCGCTTIDLTVPPEMRVTDPPPERLIADTFGRVNGKLVGVMLLQTQGLLVLLEVYRLEDVSDDPFGLPLVDTIERAIWNTPGQSAP